MFCYLTLTSLYYSLLLLKKKKQKNHLTHLDLADLEIPVTNNNQVVDGRSGSKIPIKTKTIKKHSKVKRDLNVMDVQQRPTVDEIEWDVDGENDEKKDIEREVDDIDDDDDDEDEELNEHDVIKEISTLALEDVQQMSSNDQSDPIVLISSGDSYSGDIDEFFLIEAPNARFSPAAMAANAAAAANGSSNNQTITTKTMHEFNADGVEKVTIIKEEVGPNGEIIVTEETQEYPSLIAEGRGTAMNVITSDTDTDDQASPIEILSINDALQAEAADNAQHDNTRKTLGSSSGSDIALHEPGAESSDDETGTV